MHILRQSIAKAKASHIASHIASYIASHIASQIVSNKDTYNAYRKYQRLLQSRLNVSFKADNQGAGEDLKQSLNFIVKIYDKTRVKSMPEDGL